MLSATELYVKGHHQDLLPATTLQAATSTLLLVQADRQETRTALALTLSGRMKPTAGTAVWGHDPDLAHLRRHTALLDAPGVSEPERHLSVKDLVAEDLALIPRKFRDRTRPTAWLVKNGYSDLIGKWIEELQPEQRLNLLADLALADADVDVLVVDSPDRHSEDPQDWLPLLQRLAGTPDDDGGRGLTIIATVGSVPAEWDGEVARVGDLPRESDTAAETAKVGPEPVQAHAETAAVEPAEAGPTQAHAETAVVNPATERPEHTEESQEIR